MGVPGGTRASYSGHFWDANLLVPGPLPHTTAPSSPGLLSTDVLVGVHARPPVGSPCPPPVSVHARPLSLPPPSHWSYLHAYFYAYSRMYAFLTYLLTFLCTSLHACMLLAVRTFVHNHLLTQLQTYRLNDVHVLADLLTCLPTF